MRKLELEILRRIFSFFWRSLTDTEAFVLNLGQEKSLSNLGWPGGVTQSGSVPATPISI